MINAKLQNIIDTKSAIGNAIVNKGGTITGETPFFNYAAQIDGISTGTPQTIFTASDGSKWALTNAVNLVNDAGNVTSDFNYWQPANNSTSDPILNVGTVGANISGNIRLVPVNQVNIAQYVNIVATDTNGAKYVGYNGYDFGTNPTPSGNTTFNFWLLNNSATGTVLFSNATFNFVANYAGPNSSINESSMSVINNTANFSSRILSVFVNNSRVFAAGPDFNSRSIISYHTGNLVQINQSNAYGADGLLNASFNNSSVYSVGGNFFYNPVKKYFENNLVYIGESASMGSGLYSRGVATNNGFIYVAATSMIQKFHEGNLVRSANGPSFNGTLSRVAVNNGFVFAAGGINTAISKYHESNLVLSVNSPLFENFTTVLSLVVDNGYVLAGSSSINGIANWRIKRYHEGNMAFADQSPNIGSNVMSMYVDGNFIYAGVQQRSGENRSIVKLHKDNLAILANVSNLSTSGTPGDGSIYVKDDFIYYTSQFGSAQNTAVVTKLTKQGLTTENIAYYTATKIKE
jgi:hypothetical protein